MSLSESDYNNVGKPKSLELVGYAPVNVYTPATWRCLLCERVHYKTYRAVRYGKNGCICQSSRVNSKFRYESLGSSIGLFFVGTVKDSTGSESVSGMAAELGNNTADLSTRTEGRDAERKPMGSVDSNTSRASASRHRGQGTNNGVDRRGINQPNSPTDTPLDGAEQLDTRAHIHKYDGEYDPAGIPKTTKELVVWARIDAPQEKFLASFQQLSYGNGVKLKKKLGIDNV